MIQNNVAKMNGKKHTKNIQFHIGSWDSKHNPWTLDGLENYI